MLGRSGFGGNAGAPGKRKSFCYNKLHISFSQHGGNCNKTVLASVFLFGAMDYMEGF